ncbi:uncharacterized protein LOC131663689 isoform X2 [Phymastichus coffea]|uniref:uncharacterized protein LOC131663689 isoform X2 n=1 Tax=Phymastichus coffea TaxID=108790 RepID=UPI00273B6E3D|nr:uncharacterized protein LOC131663689 isoform X2 [Phymastichus coffea]
MVSNDFDVEQFERRLQTLKDSQESIQSLSSWCLERRQHHKKIVATWLQVLKKVKVEHRLTLFYLANDVIQYSKRKNFEFVESWGTTLQRATTMVRDEKVKHRVLRIFKIWDQRQVYDEEFLADLSGLISAAPKKKVEPQPIQQSEEFQAALLISTMRSCATLEQATDARLRDLKDCSVDIDSVEELRSSLKDRRRVEDAEKDVDLAARNIENYVRSLEAEIRERKQVLDLLEQADQFYETQKGEVKIVVNAYRNFGSRVKNLKKKLDELLPKLASPLPSPDINAPSPSPDSDIELPGEESQINQSTLINVAPPSMYGTYGSDYNPVTAPINNTTSDFSNNFSSFIGENLDFDPRNIFSENSVSGTSQQYDILENKSSEVIDIHSSLDTNNEEPVSSFLKTVLPSSDSTNSCGIPGLGMDAADAMTDNMQCNDYRPLSMGPISNTPIMGRMLGIPTTPIGNHSQISHSTPLHSRNLNGESHTPSPYSSENSQNNPVISMNSFDSTTVNPLQPPPMPPIEFLEDNNCYKLPPKFPTWTFANETPKEPVFPVVNDTTPVWPPSDKIKNQWNESSNEQWDMSNDPNWSDSIRIKNEILSETPESPPMYEKTSYNQPVEYNDSQSQEPILSSVGDVDHRVLAVPITADKQLPHRLMKGADVDHRNLISLTGSPANNSNDAMTGSLSNDNLWTNTDQDYRRPNIPVGDNVESVDMEMSDEEGEGKKGNRVLVDLRSQDRDMRVPNMPPGPPPGPPQHHHTADMDMRMMPGPGGPPVNPMGLQRGGNVGPDLHGVDTRPPPPPPPPPPGFHPGQINFQQNQSDFRHNKSMDFRPNQPFHPNQQEFRPNQSFPPPQQDFPPGQLEFEFFDSPHGRGAPMQRGGGNGRGIGTGGPFRGAGGPRPPWMDRGGPGPRPPMLMSGFPPGCPPTRGMKPRGGPFRGGPAGFRGRGRGGNAW